MEEQNNAGQKACPFCGEQISVVAKKCKHCGEIIDPAMREIENLKRQQQNSSSGPIIVNNNNNNNNNNNGPQAHYLPKSRVTFIILAILFGAFGIHNFYIRKGGIGFIQLLLTCSVVGSGIVLVWVLIEIFVVKSDGNGYALT